MLSRRRGNERICEEKATNPLEGNVYFWDATVTSGKFENRNIIDKVGIRVISTTQQTATKAIRTDNGGRDLWRVEAQHEKVARGLLAWDLDVAVAMRDMNGIVSHL